MFSYAGVTSLVFISCIITSLSRITLKKGLLHSNAMTGMVYSLLFGWIILVVLTLIDLKNQIFSVKGILFFSAIGIIAPPVVRYMTYLGVEKLGPSRSDPIRSLTPLFAVAFAFIFFEEQFNFSSLWGCLLIFAGSYVLNLDANQVEKKIFQTSDLIYPFIAAVIAGLVSNFRKIGMNLEITSLAAATSAATSALFVFGIFLVYKKNYKKIIINKMSVKYLLATGALASITDIIDLIALKNSKVSIVAPLLATTPLFVILFSWLFLKNIEKITRNLVIGAVLICTGILTITLING